MVLRVRYVAMVAVCVLSGVAFGSSLGELPECVTGASACARYGPPQFSFDPPNPYPGYCCLPVVGGEVFTVSGSGLGAVDRGPLQCGLWWEEVDGRCAQRLGHCGGNWADTKCVIIASANPSKAFRGRVLGVLPAGL